MPALTLDQLKDIFQEITARILPELDRTLIRRAYQQQGQPGMNIPDNAIFFHLDNQASPWDKLRDTQQSNFDANGSDHATFYTRVIRVDWYLYGPSSFDFADIIKLQLLSEPILGYLQTYQIAPIRDIDPARHVPEAFNGQWRERADLSALFNVLTDRTRRIPFFKAAHIETDAGGDSRVIELP